MKPAAESPKEKGKAAFGGGVHIVGAPATVSGDRGNGGQTSGAALL
jgi:hypothetical protein